ncbi:13542_t:CDS:2, partial [Acaulospora morrowiae]
DTELKSLPQEIYLNSDGYFGDVESYSNVIPLATFKDHDHAAVIKCDLGLGKAILCGVDPFSPFTNDQDNDGKGDEYTVRKQFIRSLLSVLGIVSTDISIPNLSKEIYLRALRPASRDNLLHNIKQLEESDGTIKAEYNSFQVIRSNENEDFTNNNSDSQMLNIMADDELPSLSHFDFEKYFRSLSNARHSTDAYKFRELEFGSLILYGEVLESTQTLLEKNIKFTKQLPNGFVTVATQQTQGHGRGGNTWISPPGCLQFSFVMRHSVKLQSAPVVFIQYLLSLSVVEAVRTKPGYEEIPLKLKWPNDIYAEIIDSSSKLPKLIKIGGVLVKSEFFNNEFLLISGCGANLDNAAPTTSINQLIQNYNQSQHVSKQLRPLSQEELLAEILVEFEMLYKEFCERGYESFLDVYYKRWLHRTNVPEDRSNRNRLIDDEAKRIVVSLAVGAASLISVPPVATVANTLVTHAIDVINGDAEYPGERLMNIRPNHVNDVVGLARNQVRRFLGNH